MQIAWINLERLGSWHALLFASSLPIHAKSHSSTGGNFRNFSYPNIQKSITI
jgi:hypothetical protein